MRSAPCHPQYTMTPVADIIPGDKVFIKSIRSVGVVESVRPDRYDRNRTEISFKDSARMFGTDVRIVVPCYACVPVIQG